MINEQNVKRFCCEDISLIENYDKAMTDTSQVWDCHHRLELHPDNSVRFTRKSLKKVGLYYHRPAGELIFLTHAEHARMDKKGENHPLYGKPSWNRGKKLSPETKTKISEALRGKTMSPETRAKISSAQKGRNHPFYGKHLDAEHRAKLSEANRGKTMSPETKAKISESLRGKKQPPLTEDHRAKVAEALRKYWEKKRAETNNEQEVLSP